MLDFGIGNFTIIYLSRLKVSLTKVSGHNQIKVTYKTFNTEINIHVPSESEYPMCEI
jgi:hypothetical protein